MTAPRASPTGKGPGPAWLGLVVGGAVIILAIVIITLVITGSTPPPFHGPARLGVTLPEPVLPDVPRIPERPVVPPVDPRVDTGPAGSPAG
ncbi:MAG: hypothetical protein ACI9YM_001776 [Brevundimonas sp.]|jgi:hypothetical protein|uniref:hypothetical protein n=1 Tax=Brevundimonas sp. TaxID=1871086 RepID=UPI0039E4D860